MIFFIDMVRCYPLNLCFFVQVPLTYCGYKKLMWSKWFEMSNLTTLFVLIKNLIKLIKGQWFVKVIIKNWFN
jgi:hypothetical protein